MAQAFCCGKQRKVGRDMKGICTGLAFILFGSTVAAAQVDATQPAAESAPQPLAIAGGIDFQSKYFFRGFATTKSGLIAQPYLQIAYTVLDRKDFDGSELTIAPYIGTWSNVTSHPYQIRKGRTGDPRWLSEVDANLGATATWKNFTLAVNYIYYSYPNGSIDSDMEAGVSLAYDDSDRWDDQTLFAGFNPHVAYYHEIQNLAGPNGGYLEFGIAPTLKPINVGSVPLTFSAPITVGLSTDRYYTDSHGATEPLGYVEIGANVSLPLTFMSDHVGGTWTLCGEVDYYVLNASNVRALDNGKSNDVSARIGLSFKY